VLDTDLLALDENSTRSRSTTWSSSRHKSQVK
jgi:hypothetical protein